MNMFRLLTADEIECRISRQTDKGLSLLLYKTARTDANLLDETVGVANWMNDFRVVDGVLYGGIGIYSEAQKEWIWKWDAGTESNTEAEKGRASDAFKRAGFKWGIGRELYTAPFIWIDLEKYAINDKGKCKDSFSVSEIEYSEKGEIVKLKIINDRTKQEVFPKRCVIKYGESMNADVPFAPEESTKDQNADEPIQFDKLTNTYFARCADCGGIVKDQKKKDGSTFTVQDYVAASLKIYGRVVCNKCRKSNGTTD